jgi:hypothetical protein
VAVSGIKSSDFVCVEQGRLTFLELLQTLEGDLKLIGISELGGVIENVDAEQ